jgi:hypothetical protein
MTHMDESAAIIAIKSHMDDLLARVNSATKYPSIETYHRLERGRLTDEVQVDFAGVGDIIATEKIDGTNSRVLLFLNHEVLPWLFEKYLIGSREDLLHARGDLIYNPAQGIVEGVRPFAERVHSGSLWNNKIYVFFGEVYGGRGVTQASKFYSKDGSQVGFRLFDAIEFKVQDFRDLIEMPKEKIAAWRQSGGQPFVSEARLQEFAEMFEVELTPRFAAPPIPTEPHETHEWLKQVLAEGSRAVLGDEPGKGKPEGVVVRTSDRSKIAKIRFEDYERANRR